MEPDFSPLYTELDLPPDCSLEEFKRAYHRRITELHPDHKRGDPPSPEEQAALAALISTYVAVKRFHRRHGRMPGAPTRSSAMDDARTGSPLLPRHRLPVPVPVAAKDAPVWTARELLILFLVLLVVLASWDWLMLDS